MARQSEWPTITSPQLTHLCPWQSPDEGQEVAPTLGQTSSWLGHRPLELDFSRGTKTRKNHVAFPFPNEDNDLTNCEVAWKVVFSGQSAKLKLHHWAPYKGKNSSGYKKDRHLWANELMSQVGSCNRMSLIYPILEHWLIPQKEKETHNVAWSKNKVFIFS